MPADPRLKAQIDLILHEHEDAAAFPEDWEEVGDVDYVYRQNTILTREQDEARVTEALTQILREAGSDVPEGERPFETRRAVGLVWGTCFV